MSTPRTDAVGNNGGYYRSKEHGWYIPADFCRQLETELKAEREKVTKLRKYAEECVRMLNLDDNDSYAADDREGAIDTAHGVLTKALEETK